MAITVTIPSRTVTIDHCTQCPFFKLDGGPSPIMYCGHPSLAGAGQDECCIITHPICDTGFPAKCPLRATGQVRS